MAVLREIWRGIAVFFVLILLAVIYFYQFHVFETLRVCVTNEEEVTEFACFDSQECWDYIANVEEINAILKDFNLNRSRRWPGKYYHIQNIAVPKGTEYYWICKFENLHDKVKWVGFDYPSQIHN